MPRSHTARSAIAACLLCTMLAAWAAPPDRLAPARLRPTPTAFDAELERFQSGSEGVDRAESLAKLRLLVPPGDQARTMRYRVAHCEELIRRDPAASLEYAAQQLEEAEQQGNVEARIRLLYCRGLSRGTVTMPKHALPDFNAAIDLARDHRLPEFLAMGLAQRGSVRSLLGDQALALADFLEAQDRYVEAGETGEAERNLINIATAYRRMGEEAKALEYLDESIRIARRVENATSLFTALMQEGFLHEGAGRPSETYRVFKEALAVATDGTQLQQDIGHARLGLAGALVDLQRPSEALTVLRSAVNDFAAVGDATNEDFIQFLSGRAYAGLHRHKLALRHYNVAQRKFERAENQRYLVMLYEARAKSHDALDRPRDALEDYRRYMELRDVLDAQLHDQQTAMLRHQFDASRRELENRALRARQQAQEQRVAALMKARHWQWSAIGLGSILILLLAGLAVRQLLRVRKLSTLAVTDVLTGVPNRRGIERYGREAVAQALAAGQAASVLTFDIDHFKRINDTFGHAAGDEVLTRIATACQNALRPFDMIGRTGGEEFLVVLPDATLEQAGNVAERLRECVSNLSFDQLRQGLRVTVSLGVAELHPGDVDFETLVHRADNALYRAKGNGRNRIEVECEDAACEGRGKAGPARDRPAGRQMKSLPEREAGFTI